MPGTSISVATRDESAGSISDASGERERHLSFRERGSSVKGPTIAGRTNSSGSISEGQGEHERHLGVSQRKSTIRGSFAHRTDSSGSISEAPGEHERHLGFSQRKSTIRGSFAHRTDSSGSISEAPGDHERHLAFRQRRSTIGGALAHRMDGSGSTSEGLGVRRLGPDGVSDAPSALALKFARAASKVIVLGFFGRDVEESEEVRLRRRTAGVARRKPTFHLGSFSGREKSLTTEGEHSVQVGHSTHPSIVLDSDASKKSSLASTHTLLEPEQAQADAQLTVSTLSVKPKVIRSAMLRKAAGDLKKAKKKPVAQPKEEKEEPLKIFYDNREYMQFLATIEKFSMRNLFNHRPTPKSITGSSALGADITRTCVTTKTDGREFRGLSKDDIVPSRREEATRETHKVKKLRKSEVPKTRRVKDPSHLVFSPRPPKKSRLPPRKGRRVVQKDQKGESKPAQTRATVKKPVDKEAMESPEAYTKRIAQRKNWAQRHYLLHVQEFESEALKKRVKAFMEATLAYIKQQRTKYYYKEIKEDGYAYNALHSVDKE